MRNAETVLGIISERGRRRLPLEDIYRQLFNRDLFLRAYGRIYRNDGAMTPGSTSETVDAMSLEKIDAIIDALRHERYRWTPVRRMYIPKKSGKLRPLGIPTWSDKLLQEVVRSLLDADYEPQFSGHVPPPTYQVAATTCLSLTSVRRRASNDLPVARHGVALTETSLLREVAMSKRACRFHAVVRSSRPSGAACPSTKSLVSSVSANRRYTTGSSGQAVRDWTGWIGRTDRPSPARRDAHQPASRT